MVLVGLFLSVWIVEQYENLNVSVRSVSAQRQRSKWQPLALNGDKSLCQLKLCNKWTYFSCGVASVSEVSALVQTT